MAQKARTFLLMGSGEFEPWSNEIEAAALDGRTGPVVVLPTASSTEGEDVFGVGFPCRDGGFVGPVANGDTDTFTSRVDAEETDAAVLSVMIATAPEAKARMMPGT